MAIQPKIYGDRPLSLLIATAVSPPRVEGAGGLAGRRTYPGLVHEARNIVLKNMMVVRYQWVIQVVPVGDTTS